MRDPATGKEKEACGYSPDTTNNRMELQAVIEGLSALKKPCQVELFTDSVYVGKGMEEWMAGWKRNGWKRKQKGRLVPVKNQEFWMKLDELLQSHDVKYTRVAGHSGHPENDRCDQSRAHIRTAARSQLCRHGRPRVRIGADFRRASPSPLLESVSVERYIHERQAIKTN